MIIFGQKRPNLIVCRGCGCDDDHACEGGCAWVLLDTNRVSGVCSVCAIECEWHPVILATAGFADLNAGGAA